MFVFEKHVFHNHKCFWKDTFQYCTWTCFGIASYLVIRKCGEALTLLFTSNFILSISQNFCFPLFDGLRCKKVHTTLLLRSGFDVKSTPTPQIAKFVQTLASHFRRNFFQEIGFSDLEEQLKRFLVIMRNTWQCSRNHCASISKITWKQFKI